MELRFLIILLTFYVKNIHGLSNNDDEAKAMIIVNKICKEMSMQLNKATEASWKYATNLTEENERENAKEQENYAIYIKNAAEDLSTFDYKSFKNETLKRLIKSLTNIGDAKLSDDDFREVQDAVLRMQSVYSKVKIPSFKDNTKFVSLEPEITEVFANSHNPEELKYYWVKWYDAAGTANKKDFFKYVELRNKAAKLNGKIFYLKIFFNG